MTTPTNTPRVTDPEADEALRKVLPAHAHISDDGKQWRARWTTPAGTWTIVHGFTLPLMPGEQPWYSIKGPDLLLGLSPATVDKAISALLLFGAIGDGNADLGLLAPAEASSETLTQEGPRPTLALVDDLDGVTALARHGH